MSEKIKLDDFDRKILKCLSASARISNREIARNLDVTEGTVRSRLKKLRENKAIRIQAVTNVAELDTPPVMAYIGIDVDHNQVNEVAKKMAGMQEIRFVATLLGRFDILAITVAASMEQILETIDGKVVNIPGVRHTETTISLKHLKYDYRWGRIVD